MSQSLVQAFLHIVFSTKFRQPFITNEIAQPLYRYIGGICAKLDCQPIIIGGHLNHIHILSCLSKNITISKLLEQVKSGSSRWLRMQKGNENFNWQSGYAAFSVYQKDIKVVTTYISNQQHHHQHTPFEDELRELLKENAIVFDERYLWD